MTTEAGSRRAHDLDGPMYIRREKRRGWRERGGNGGGACAGHDTSYSCHIRVLDHNCRLCTSCRYRRRLPLVLGARDSSVYPEECAFVDVLGAVPTGAVWELEERKTA